MKKSRIVAIIPARGGSKGIPRKNIKPLGGKPLIAWTIEEAKKSRFLDRVIVSTEDNEIAKISRDYGADVIRRPIKLAKDDTPTEPVIEHVINNLKKYEGYNPKIIVLLQPTSPLRKSKHIDKAFEFFMEGKYDSLLSVCPFSGFIWRKKNDTSVSVNYNYKKRPRRQDKPLEYKENGAIYITRYKIFMEMHNRLGGKIGLYIMPEENSIEIDTEFDFWLCEQIIKNGNKI